MNTTRNKRLILGGEYDIKKIVGPRQHFTTIEELILKCPAPALVDGLLIEDMNYSVTWQLYKKDSAWKYRLYDGTFYVAAVVMGSPNIVSNVFNGAHTGDGHVLVTGETALVVNYTAPHMNGLWRVNTDGAWVRHPFFDSGDLDNIYGVMFVPMNGTTYKNTQWVFTTYGDITLSSDATDFSTATWLDFEMLTPTKNYLSQSVTEPGSIARFQKNTYADATTADIEMSASAALMLGVEYNLYKEDTTANYVVLTSASGTPIWVLTEQNDYVTFHQTEAGDGYKFKSNRKNSLLVPAQLSADGKLSIDVPTGYLLWGIHIKASAEIILTLGTSDGGAQIDAGYEATTAWTFKEVKDEITEIWVKETLEEGWGVRTVDFKLLIVKL